MAAPVRWHPNLRPASVRPASLRPPCLRPAARLAPRLAPLLAPLALGLLLGAGLAGRADAQGNPPVDDATRRRRAAAAEGRGTFEVQPGSTPDMLEAYEGLAKSDRPVFVTTDLVLHGTHRIIDAAVANIEEEAILPALEEAIGALLDAAVFDAKNLKGPVRRSAAAWNAGFLAVTQALLSGRPLDEARLAGFEAGAVVAAAKEELALVLGHEGVRLSPLFGASPLRSLAGPNGEDYGSYMPRGHYTRSEPLGRYFRGRLYIGRMAFALPDSGAATSQADLRLIQQSLHLSSILATRGGVSEPWGEVTRFDRFLGGEPDDVQPAKITALWSQFKSAQGKSAGPVTEKEADSGRLLEFADLVRRESNPQIREGYVDGMRLLPLAAPWDLAVFDVLTRDPERTLPKGLDVMALLGSVEARARLEEEGDLGQSWYWTAFEALWPTRPAAAAEAGVRGVRAAPALPERWLRTVARLFEPVPSDVPQFLRDPEWRWKDLATGSASWAELRHDTILYAKQPPGMGIKYDFKHLEQFTPPAYLEPRPEVYAELIALARAFDQTVTGSKRSLPVVAAASGALVNALVPLGQIARAELEGDSLGAGDRDHLRGLARELGAIEARLLPNNKPGEGPVIADVFADHSRGTPRYLLVGTGVPLHIAVVVRPGYPAFEGALSCYHEFASSERLTDEAWRSRIIHGSTPALPDWEADWLARLR